MSDNASSQALENLSTEDRRFPPSETFAAQAVAKADLYDEAAADRGRSGPSRLATSSPGTPTSTQTLDWSEAPFAQVVRRREAQRRLQLRRPARRGRARRPGRHPLRGRARRHPHDHLRRAQGRGQPGRERPHRPRRRGRRPRRDLPADDPRGRHLDARLRPHRSGALRGVRRLLGRRARVPHRRRRGQGRHHRRRRLPARLGVRAQARGRRRAGEGVPRAASRKVLVVRRTEQDVEWDDSRDVWWHDAVGSALDRARPAGVRLRAAAVHPLHLRHDREAEGHPAHLRRLPDADGVHPPQRLRPQARDRRLLVHRRRRLGHRPLLHRLRPARERRDAGDVRGHPGHPAPGPLVGDRREVRRDDPLHRPHRDPHVHEVGRADPRRARPVLAAPARLGRRADQPRGVDVVPPRHRRRPRARSWTPGGRPRPARS